MSEPIRSNQVQRTSPPIPPRPQSAQLPEFHPNQEVVLDEMGEGELVENKLVIPDEMMQYLNQVITPFPILTVFSCRFFFISNRYICFYRFKQVEIKLVIAEVLYRFVNRLYARILCIISDRCSPRAITISRTAIPFNSLLSNPVPITKTPLPRLTSVRIRV